jgi:hypothetical protein
MILLATLPLGWLSVKLERARRQRDFGKMLEKFHGFCQYETGCASSLRLDPAWLRRLLGDEFFDTAVVIYVSHAPLCDAQMDAFPAWTEVRCLTLEDIRITDAALRHLRDAKNLRELVINDCRITDAGLENLHELREMESLNLSGTLITDNGLRQLDRMSRLKGLGLCNTRVTDAGLTILDRLPALEDLELSGTHIKGPGLEHVSRLAKLSRLMLDNTDVNDDGLRYLAPLPPMLKDLNLNCPGLTDKAVDQLTTMRQLQDLVVGHGITRSRLDDLNIALPNTRVY